jgi:hypothetical protein
MEWSRLDWFSPGQGPRALLNTVVNLQVPQNVRKFLNSCTTGSLSRRTQLHGVVRWRRQRDRRNHKSRFGGREIEVVQRERCDLYDRMNEVIYLFPLTGPTTYYVMYLHTYKFSGSICIRTPTFYITWITTAILPFLNGNFGKHDG